MSAHTDTQCYLNHLSSITPGTTRARRRRRRRPVFIVQTAKPNLIMSTESQPATSQLKQSQFKPPAGITATESMGGGGWLPETASMSSLAGGLLLWPLLLVSSWPLLLSSSFLPLSSIPHDVFLVSAASFPVSTPAPLDKPVNTALGNNIKEARHASMNICPSCRLPEKQAELQHLLRQKVQSVAPEMAPHLCSSAPRLLLGSFRLFLPLQTHPK